MIVHRFVAKAWLLFCVSVLVSAGLASLPVGAEAADRTLIVTPNADYAGFDYNTLRDITIDGCKAACIGDQTCHAFTFNEHARWCFMKSDFGALSQAAGATAGRIVETQPVNPSIQARRLGDLDFLQGAYIDEARSLIGSMPQFVDPTRGFTALLDAANQAGATGNADAVAEALHHALAFASEDPDLWLRFALATLDRSPPDYDAQQRAYSDATGAAINAFLRSDTDGERARSLAVLGASLARRESWRLAIFSYRNSLAIQENTTIRATYERVVAEHGFRITSHEVDADSDTPRICILFSDSLPSGDAGLADYVTVDGAQGVAIEPQDAQICITGVAFGSRYHIRVRAGLPSAYGETLSRTVELDVFVRDRSPWVGFTGNAYVLPAGDGASLPMQSVNTESADATIYRVNSRSVAEVVRDGPFQQQLTGSDAEELAAREGELVWQGTITVKPELNQMVTTAVPIGEVLTKLEAGVYVITAKPTGSTQDDYWETQATQWFVISDLGISELGADDGVHAIVRSLSTTEPVVGATVQLIAVNNEILGEAATDSHGYAHFDPGLARGTGGAAPQLLVVETASDYAFLDLTRAAFDLTDRGVEGRPAPGPVDVFASTERGVYRPSETVHLTVLARDSRAQALPSLPLTAVLFRPDGVEDKRLTANDEGLGGYGIDLPLQDDAMRGSWRIALYADPKGSPIGETSFLVEDFVPQRLVFEATTEAAQFSTEVPAAIDIAAKYLYGATAPNLTVDGDVAIRPVRARAGYDGFVFGREDDTTETSRQPIDDTAVTDEGGNAVLDFSLPEPQSTTLPLEADLILRITDTSGRAVEKTITRPVRPAGDMIGVKSLFDDGVVPQGQAASFEIIAVDPDGNRTAASGLAWVLERLETRYQWYRANGSWHYETVTTARKVADGTVDVTDTTSAKVGAPVDWGRYRLTVENPDQTASSSVDFYAGWYVAVGDDTPDVLPVALDKSSYRVGDVARLRIDPRFAGTAIITVLDDRLIAMQEVAVPEGGTTVELPVTADWGAGAYVTATLLRPMDVEARRMPARALGLAWAKVDPGDRDLAVSIDLPVESPPRGPLAIPVSIDNLAPGEEAYVTVAAVDFGILSLTNFAPPAPEGWYFGQRRLGVDIRDIYGQLIDRMQGTPGGIRSGGDSAPRALASPPPTEKLVAFYSGVVRVGADGKALISFDMPDFNGTVRVMAVAWSAKGVGHAVKDVFVRDPVVVNVSLPRFLAVGDQSRLLIEIDNVSGPAGGYGLDVAAEGGVGLQTQPEDTAFTLAEKEKRTVIVPITGDAVGDELIVVSLTLPDGRTLPKNLMLGVRPAGQPSTRSQPLVLAPGQTLTLDAAMLSDYVPGTTMITASLGGAGPIDVPGLLASLDRYPYGCAEQITSRAMPLVYLDDVSRSIGLAGEDEVRQRVQDAIYKVLGNQTAAGDFGLWGPYSSGDLWLSSYVTDFLTRAAEKGYQVPDVARAIALDNLSNRVAYASDFSSGGEDIAYALYVLARNGRASIGDLRYYAESRISAFATPLAKAQIGAALALYGDRIRAAAAFDAAIAQIATVRQDTWRSDYGTTLRDTAAVLTLAAETGQQSVDLRGLAAEIAADRSSRRYTSTQEDAWTLMAAAALISDSQATTITVNGSVVPTPLYRRYLGENLDGSPVVVANTGNAPIQGLLSVSGVPVTPGPAEDNGFTIERAYFHTDGSPADVSVVGQNDRFVVVLTVTGTTVRPGKLLVVDPIPAGFEIENPNLSASGDVQQYDWLPTESGVEHTEARTDRFVAALDRNEDDPLQFTVAYSVRAVSPGVFAHPAALVEDMYQPQIRGNTDSGKVEVVGPMQ